MWYCNFKKHRDLCQHGSDVSFWIGNTLCKLLHLVLQIQNTVSTSVFELAIPFANYYIWYCKFKTNVQHMYTMHVAPTLGVQIQHCVEFALQVWVPLHSGHVCALYFGLSVLVQQRWLVVTIHTTHMSAKCANKPDMHICKTTGVHMVCGTQLCLNLQY